MTELEISDSVVVQVIDVKSGRAISWDSAIIEKLRDRAADVRNAIVAGAAAASADLESLPSSGRWRPSEVSVTFGITLAAETGVVISRASADVTFEVSVKYQRS